MASLVVRNIPDEVKERLRRRAAAEGRSMEAEARRIISKALESDAAEGETFGELVARHFGPENGFDLEPYLPEREPVRDPPNFD